MLARVVKWSCRALKTALVRIPICGHVFLARPDSRKAAVTELLIAALFSLLPIWLYPVLLLLSDQPFWETVVSCVERGELYLYSAALLGPLIYSVSKQYGAHGGDAARISSNGHDGYPRMLVLQFPHGTAFSVVSLIVIVLAGGAFAVVRASSDGIWTLPVNTNTMLTVSVSLYTFTLFCLFCALVYRLDLEDLQNQFGEQTEALSTQWRDRS